MKEEATARSRRLADPAEGPRILGALKEEKRWRRELNIAWHRTGDPGREDTPLEQVDRSDWKRLFKLKSRHFPSAWAEALGSFRKRWNRYGWMQDQHGYLEKAALAASSRGKFDGRRYCYCQPGKRCGQVHYCPRCKYVQEIIPAFEEYREAFNKAAFWFALVPSITYDPENAGLHYVVSKRSNGRAKQYRHLRPFKDSRPRRGLTVDIADFRAVELLLRVPFELAKMMQARELSDGAYVTREVALDFVPRSEPVPDQELRVVEVVLPHGNCLFNTRRKPGWRLALECWIVLLQIWRDWNLYRYGFPDLLVGKAMVDQQEIERWIGYELKPMPFEKFYKSGIRHGCLIEDLNHLFDQTIFWHIKEAFNSVRSPRKYGNMNSDPRSHAHPVPPHRRYLGTKPPNRMIKRIRSKILKCKKQVPEGDLMEMLSHNEIQFLAEHGLGHNRMSLDDLQRLEGEP